MRHRHNGRNSSEISKAAQAEANSPLRKDFNSRLSFLEGRQEGAGLSAEEIDRLAEVLAGFFAEKNILLDDPNNYENIFFEELNKILRGKLTQEELNSIMNKYVANMSKKTRQPHNHGIAKKHHA